MLTKVVPPVYGREPSFPGYLQWLLGLEHGHGDGSCVAYVLLGMLAGSHFGDYEAGYRLARLGYELVEQRGLRRFQAPTYVSRSPIA